MKVYNTTLCANLEPTDLELPIAHGISERLYKSLELSATPLLTTVRHIGTPIGGEWKSRRVQSPLQELDGVTENAQRGEVTLGRQPTLEEPQTSPSVCPGLPADGSGSPAENNAITLETMERSFDRKLRPICENIVALKAHGVPRNEMTAT